MSDIEQVVTAEPQGNVLPTTVKFTDKEERILKLAWFYLKTTPEVDIKRFTEGGHFNTEKTASNTWGVIKKKLQQAAIQNGVELSTPAKSTKKESCVRKRKVDEDAEAETGAGDEGTPTRKPRRISPKKAAKVKSEEVIKVEDDEDAADLD